MIVILHNQRIPLSQKERYYILARDSFTCQYCGRSAPDVELHVDHIVPVARGGTNSKINLLASCADCNLSKQAKPLSSTIIKEKQEAIIRRTEAYEQFLVENPLNIKESNQSTHLNERPSHLLREYTTIHDPLKNRTLNPKKRHALKINIEDDLNVYLSYARKDVKSWHLEPLSMREERGLVPMSVYDFNTLYDTDTFTEMDRVSEEETEVHVLVQETGIHIIIVTDESGSLAFAFWSPISDLEIAVEIQNDTGEDNGMNDCSFDTFSQ